MLFASGRHLFRRKLEGLWKMALTNKLNKALLLQVEKELRVGI
jgi:hypothetical protein